MTYNRFFLVFLIFLLFNCYAHPVVGQKSSVEDWETDVDFLLDKILSIHPNPFRKYSLDEWYQKAEKLKKNKPDNDAEAALKLYRFMTMASDGHTEAAVVAPSLRWHWLPISIKRFSNGWYVKSGDIRYQNLFGKQITSINKTPIDTVAKQLRPYVSSDNAIGALDRIGNLMRNAIILEELGIASRDSVNIIVGRNNDLAKVKVIPTKDPWVTDRWTDADNKLGSGPEPLYQKFDRNYAFEYLHDEKLIYVWFSKIRDEEDESIKDFFSRVFDFIERNDVNRMVLDIRENSGGNLDLNGPIVNGLIRSRKVNYPGGLFVITGRDTYSAAMNLAVLLEKHAYSIFAGEPTGATPNHFGDTRKFEMPHTKLTIEISELYWQNSDPRDKRPWITPDIPVSLSFDDFIQRRDPVLEAILDFHPSDSLKNNFGSPLKRWTRSNQNAKEVWPTLLQTKN